MHFKNDFFIEVNGERIDGKAGDFVLHSPKGNYSHGSRCENEGFINDWFFFSSDFPAEKRKKIAFSTCGNRCFVLYLPYPLLEVLQ